MPAKDQVEVEEPSVESQRSPLGLQPQWQAPQQNPVLPLQSQWAQPSTSAAPPPPAPTGRAAAAPAPPPAPTSPQEAQQPSAYWAARQQGGQYAGGSTPVGPSTAGEFPAEPGTQQQPPQEPQQRGVWGTQTQQPAQEPSQTAWGNQPEGAFVAPQQQEGFIAPTKTEDGFVDPNTLAAEKVKEFGTATNIQNAFAHGQIDKPTAINAIGLLQGSFKLADKNSQTSLLSAEGQSALELHPKPSEEGRAAAGETFESILASALPKAINTLDINGVRNHLVDQAKNGKISMDEYDKSSALLDKAQNIFSNDSRMRGGVGLGTTPQSAQGSQQAQLEILNYIDQADPAWAKFRPTQAAQELEYAKKNFATDWQNMLKPTTKVSGIAGQVSPIPDPTGGGTNLLQKNSDQLNASLDKAKSDLDATIARYSSPEIDQKVAPEVRQQMSEAGMEPKLEAQTGLTPLVTETGEALISALPMPWEGAVMKGLGKVIGPVGGAGARTGEWLSERGAKIMRKPWPGLGAGVTYAAIEAAAHPTETLKRLQDPKQWLDEAKLLSLEVGIPTAFGLGVWGTGKGFQLGGNILRAATGEARVPLIKGIARGLGAGEGEAATIPFRAGQGPLVQLGGRTIESYLKGATRVAPFAGLNSQDIGQFAQQVNQGGVVNALLSSPGNVASSLRGSLFDPLYVYRGENPNAANVKSLPLRTYGPYTDPVTGQTLHLDGAMDKAVRSIDPSRQASFKMLQDVAADYADVRLLPDKQVDSIAQQRGYQVNPSGWTMGPGAGGKMEVFIKASQFDPAAFHEIAGHIPYRLLSASDRAAWQHLVGQMRSVDDFVNTYANRANPNLGRKLSLNDLPSEAEITPSNPQFDPQKHQFAASIGNLSKERAYEEMGAETLGSLFSGDTIDKWTKNPSLRRRATYFIGSAMENAGLPTTTSDVNGPIGVPKSVLAAKMMDGFLRDYAQGQIPSTGAAKNYFGGGGAAATPQTVWNPPGGGGIGGGGIKPANVLSVRTIGGGAQPTPQLPAGPSVPGVTPGPPPAPTGGGAPPGAPTAAQPQPVEPIKLPEIGAAPPIDPTVIKGLMKQGFSREQAEAFARQSTVSPVHGAPKAQPVTPPAQQPTQPSKQPLQQLSEEEQHAQIRQHIQSGKSPGEAQAIVQGRQPEFIERPAQPNAYTKGRGGNQIQNIILHSSDGSEKGDVNQLTQNLSSHYYVTRDGRIYHFVNDQDSAHHAGKTIDNNRYGNSATLGIEQEHVDGKQDWPDTQVRATAKLTAYLQNKYGLGNNNILKHSDIAPERKVDPVDYPWDNFYKYVGGSGAGRGPVVQGGGVVLPKGGPELNVTRFGYRSDPNLDPESAKGHGKYVQNMVPGYDVALNEAGATKVGNPKPGEKFTYEGKEYRYGDKVPEKYADARFDVYDPGFGGGEQIAGRSGAAYMPAAGGGGGGGGGGFVAGGGGGGGGFVAGGAAVPQAGGGAGGGAAATAGAQEPERWGPSQAEIERYETSITPKPWTGGGYGAAPEEETVRPTAPMYGGGYAGGGAAFMPGGMGRRYGGIQPQEEEGAEASTVGVPNPGGGRMRQSLATGNLREAITEHTNSLSPDDTRVRRQPDNLFKGEHFQAGDELHTQVLNNVPENERHVLAGAQNAIQNRQPMHISYASAPKEGLEPVPTTKSRQIEYQMSSPQARLLGQTKAQVAGHSFIPTSIGVSLAKKQGDPHQGYIQGVSTNAAANNWHHLNSELTSMGLHSPYKKLGNKFYNDLEGYVSNLNAGHKGTGEGPAVGTEEYPSQVDPSHVPYRLGRHEADFLNAVVNNQAAKAKGAGGLRELARKGGTLLSEEGETNPIRHAIDLRQAGIRQKLAQHPENIANPVVQKAAQRLWSQDTLEPTIRSFKAGLVHSIHEHPGQMPETIRPGQEFKEITESLGRQAPHGRPDIPMAAAFMPSMGYVSPNVEEGTKLAGALKQMYSRPHRAARNFFQRVEDASRVGGKHGGIVNPTVGSWQGTAEGSAMIHDPDDSLPEMRQKNAIRGLYSAQKGTASFELHDNGPDLHYDIDFPEHSHTSVDKLIDKHGFSASTILEGPDGHLHAHLIDPSGENYEHALELANDAGAQSPEARRGTAAFDGGDTREEAAKEYRRILEEGGLQTREGRPGGPGLRGNAPSGEHPLQGLYEEAEDSFGRHRAEHERTQPGVAFMPAAAGKAPTKLEKPDWENINEAQRQSYLRKRIKQVLANQSSDPASIPLKPLRNDEGGYRHDPTGEPTFNQPGYDLVNSPLLKKKGLDQLGSAADKHEDLVDEDQHAHLNQVERRRLSALRTASAVQTMGDKIVNSYNGIKDIPEIAAGKGWYSGMRQKLADALGPDNEIFAQLLGATSAKTPVRSNFIQALDAYEQWKRGDFDNHAQKYLEAYNKMQEGDGALSQHMRNQGILGADEPDHATEADALAHWIEHHDILPKQQTGAKYNANSNAVLKVLAGTWLKEAGAPKTPNFAGNLSGRTKEATIDVWAARHLKRLGYEGLTGGKPWRDQPKGESGVSGLDFAFGQDAMRHASDKIGINPDDLQAILWYAEKHHYQDRGWTRGEGAKKASFDEVFDKVFHKSGEPMSSEEVRNHYAEEAKAARKLQGKIKTARGYHEAGSPKLAPYMEKHGLSQEHLAVPEEEEEEAA